MGLLTGRRLLRELIKFDPQAAGATLSGTAIASRYGGDWKWNEQRSETARAGLAMNEGIWRACSRECLPLGHGSDDDESRLRIAVDKDSRKSILNCAHDAALASLANVGSTISVFWRRQLLVYWPAASGLCGAPMRLGSVRFVGIAPSEYGRRIDEESAVALMLVTITAL